MKTHLINYGLILMLSILSFSVIAEEMIIKTSDGVDLHVTVKGEGMPCLYVHGGPGSGAYWMEYFAGDILEKRFKMIYLDQRGVSRSSTPENGDYSPQRMAQDFEEVRAALGIDQWLTFGHSFGGILQMAYYEYAPQSIMGMLMVNCSLNFNQAVDNLMNYAIILTDSQNDTYINDPNNPKMDRLFAALSKSREMDVWWKMHYDDKAHYDLMDDVMGNIKEWNHDFSNKAIFIPEYFKDYLPLSKEVKVPVLIFYGERDHSVGHDHYKQMLFPNNILKNYPGIHVPFIDGKAFLESAFDAYLEFYQNHSLIQI